MKEKLLSALKLKYPGVSEKTLGRIAEKKAASIADENEIDSVVETITVDTIIQSEVDARMADGNKKAADKAVTEYEKQHNLKDGKPIKKDGKDDTKPPEDVPAWATTLIEQNKQLAEKVAAFETKTKQTGFNEQLKAKLKEKGIPEKFMKGYTVNDESEIETAFTEIETNYNDIKQDIVNQAATKEIPGGGPTVKTKKDAEQAVDNWHKSRTQGQNSETKK